MNYDAPVSIAGKLRYVRKQIFGGDETVLNAGSPAPDFDVNDQRGNRVRLTDFRGKKVVLWFYPKADTPG